MDIDTFHNYSKEAKMRLRNIPGSQERIENSVYCINEPKAQKGRWNETFRNDNPIHIEIGMGKGKFLIDKAKENSDINYVGIEMYSSVLVRAVERIEKRSKCEAGFKNILFIRIDARELEEVFEKGEVEKIYLNFSDPWPKERHSKRRLTSLQFLRRYENILPPGARLEFKTDNTELFDFSIEQAREAAWHLLASTRDLHADTTLNKGNIMTEYEEKFASSGKPVCKLIIEAP